MDSHQQNHRLAGRQQLMIGVVTMLFVLVLFPTFTFAIDITNFIQIPTPYGDVLYQDPATGKFYLPNGEPAEIDPVSGVPTNMERPLVTAPIVCSGITDFFFSPIICIGRSIGAWLSGLLVFVTAWVLTIAGVLFNLVLDFTVVNFAKFVTPGVQTGINTVWTAFRDISNIVIIGMFVFIAISMILGIKEFGQKKMVAQVLIVAILINFSLLFTKIIIDASNFTALQFYTAATQSNIVPKISSTGSASGDAAGVVQGQAKTYGVAGKFMDYAGVGGFSDTVAATRAMADRLNDGLTAMLHGIFVAIMYLAAAAVLLYGAFLLIVRGILMIFLMMTASLAFASHLLPSKFTGSFGWGSWWSSLLKNAVFAPILMFFLWAVLLIAGKMSEQGGMLGKGNTIGDLIANPTDAGDMTALFGYVIVIGLLFAAIKISSSFAGKIGGFNWASVGPLIVTSAFARMGGIAGRWGVGMPANFLSDRMMQGARLLEAKQDKTAFDRLRQGALYYGSKPIKGVAQRDFNAMRTSLGGIMANAAKGALTAKNMKDMVGPKVGGGEGALKNIRAGYLKKGQELALTGADTKKIKQQENDRDDALAAARARAAASAAPTLPGAPTTPAPLAPTVETPKIDDEDRKMMREEVLKENPDLSKRKSDTDDLVKQMEAAFEKTAAESAKANKEALKILGTQIVEKQDRLSGVEGALRITPQDTAKLNEKREIEASIERDKSREKQMLSQEDIKLKEVRKQLDSAKADQRKVAEAIDTLAEETKKINKRYPKYETTKRERRGGGEVDAPISGADIAARRAGKSLTGMLLKALGGKDALSRDVFVQMQKQLKQQQRTTQVAEALKKEFDKTTPPPASPSTPATPPSTP